MQPKSGVSTLFALWPPLGEGFKVRHGYGDYIRRSQLPPTRTTKL